MTSPTPSLVDRLVEHARRQPVAPFMHRPGAPAVGFGTLADQIAHVRDRLCSWGIAPGDVVAGFAPTRALMAMACASLPASSTFAPLGPSLAVDAYEALLSRMRAKAAIAPAGDSHPLVRAARRLGVPVLRVADGESIAPGRYALSLDGDAPGRAETLARPGHAYVLVTSGTTGRPKLAPLGHRQMLAFADAMIERPALVPGDVGYGLAPFHFAGGLRSSILIPALAGASFVCLEEGDVDGFFRAIPSFRPTHVAAPFAIHRAILRRADAFPGEVAASRFRFLRTTAGRLEPEEAEALERLFRAPVLQGYGSTEVCGIAHDPMPPLLRKRGSVGTPVGGEVRALDANGRPCLPGERGELVVRGPMVFDGYLDDPALTAQAFDGEWMRTGDEGCVDEDGYVFVTGRLAELVNRGGEKISPLEVDRALETFPGVREAASFGVPHPSLGEELVAAVVPEPNAAIAEAALAAHVRERLGGRKVPRRIWLVEALPRTDAGKLRRAELPAWVGAGSSALSVGEGTADGRSPLEAALAGLWAAILRRDRVGRGDDFFAMGGDSLDAARLLGEVEAALGVRLHVREMFEGATTLAGMARAIEEARARAGRREAPAP